LRTALKSKSIVDEDVILVVERCKKLWEALRGARIFITGGTGFFGCWLLRTLIEANRLYNLQAKAVVLTRNAGGFAKTHAELAQAEEISFHKGEITKFEFPAGEFSHAIHAASELSRPNHPNPDALIESTRTGCRRIFKFAAQHGVQTVLYTSSGAVYPQRKFGTALAEEDADQQEAPSHAHATYGEAKKAGEQVCLDEATVTNVSVKIARGFAFYGPYLPLESHLAAPSFLNSALRGEKIIIQGQGQNVRSYLYGADLAQWLWTILLKGQNGRSYNVGSDVPLTIRALAESIQEACGLQAGVDVRQSSCPEKEIEYYVPNIQRAKRELGLDVFTKLKQGMLRTFQHHRKAQ